MNSIFISIYKIANNRKKNIHFFIADFLQFPSSVAVSMKMPKFKKLRQWSHDSIVNLSQLTIRSTNNNNANAKHNENPLPTTGITTISSAIHEQQIDPKKDNFGLYALKCDRSKTLANARRGVLLTLPSASSTKIKTKIETNNFQSVERNHEIFKSCETPHENEYVDDDNDVRKMNVMNQQNGVKIEAPPRKKRKAITPHISALHQKPKQPPPPIPQQHDQHQNLPRINKAGQSITTIVMDSVDKNDSGLYRIVGTTATATTTTEALKITYVEPKKKVAIVKPKVEKAVLVKSTPVPKQIAKVKDYEWNKQQRRPSKGLIKKCEAKKYAPGKISIDSKKFEESVDIFKSNRLSDQTKLFDEFDELFEKNRALNEIDRTPDTAFKKLSELKKSSSTFSIESGNEAVKELSLITVKGMNNKSDNSGGDGSANNKIMANKTDEIYDKNLARVKYVNSLLQSEDDDYDDDDVKARVDYAGDNDDKQKIERQRQHEQTEDKESTKENLKPKIVSEQVKKQHQQHVEMNTKKKIMYYNDENELQEMIMRRMQTTTTETKLSTKKISTTMDDLNENQTSLDYKHPTLLKSTMEGPNKNNNNTNSSGSNSLRRTIFVFNL